MGNSAARRHSGRPWKGGIQGGEGHLPRPGQEPVCEFNRTGRMVGLGQRVVGGLSEEKDEMIEA